MWLVLAAVAVLALVLLYFRSVEKFAFPDGWLAAYGDAFDWLEPPIWLDDSPDDEELKDLIFKADSMFLVALDGPQTFGRLLIGQGNALAGRKAKARNIAESRSEIWALVPNKDNSKRFAIRSAQGDGPYIGINSTCSQLVVGTSAFSDWTFEPARGAPRTFHISTRTGCSNNNAHYLGLKADGGLGLLSAKPQQPWTIKQVLGPKARSMGGIVAMSNQTGRPGTLAPQTGRPGTLAPQTGQMAARSVVQSPTQAVRLVTQTPKPIQMAARSVVQSPTQAVRLVTQIPTIRAGTSTATR